MKKGDLSINIIVVAAIAMLILVIISVLIFRSTGGITQGVSCQGLGENIVADCVPSTTECREDGGVVNRAASCPDRQDVCCVYAGGN